MYLDREDAGRRLTQLLRAHQDAEDVIVLGIPRGGVVVAYEVARELGLPLDIAVAAKVGAPGNPEYAIGAVAPDGQVTPNPAAGFSADEVSAMAGTAHEKVSRYSERLHAGRPEPELAGKTVLLVDDGLATGLTAMAAADWVRRSGARRVIVAVPVASSSAVEALSRHADQVIAAWVPEGFYAVGQFYERFGQTEDEEVEQLLAKSPIRASSTVARRE